MERAEDAPEAGNNESGASSGESGDYLVEGLAYVLCIVYPNILPYARAVHEH